MDPGKRRPGWRPALVADSSGLTMLELLMAMAVLTVVAMLVFSSMIIGDTLAGQHVGNADKTQQLRSAVKMLAEDLSFAQWDTSCVAPPKFADRNPPPTYYVRNVAGYVVPDSPAPADPSVPRDAVWPSAWNQVGWDRVCVYYGIEGDALIRETYRSSNLYSRRTVLTGLEEGSSIEVVTGKGTEPGQMIRVTLQLKKEGAPGGNTEVSTEFFIP